MLGCLSRFRMRQPWLRAGAQFETENLPFSFRALEPSPFAS
jgi:hypothetical protein